MSEAIILYRGRGGISEEDKRPKVYTNNGVFKAPFTGNYLVSCVGGGGGGGGGCRNSWNSSQVFYGAGGSRGGFSSGNVWLNQGDEVVMTMGSGGAGGTNNTTVVSNNSRGTNGSAGGTTTFGSYKSAAGGSYGAWSWSYHYWNNTVISGPEKMVSQKVGCISLSLGVLSKMTCYGIIPSWAGGTTSGSFTTVSKNLVFYGSDINYISMSIGWGGSNMQSQTFIHNTHLQNVNFKRFLQSLTLSYGRNTPAGETNLYNCMGYDSYNNSVSAPFISHVGWNNGSGYGIIAIRNHYFVNSLTKLNQLKSWGIWNYNYGNDIWWGWTGSIVFRADSPNMSAVFWLENKTASSKIDNVTTRCYTSIQQGTWWYLNNNVVSTAGTRAYSGDGGQSGSKGNAGFILIYPQWSE